VGSGHFNQLEVPDQVNAMIERWLTTGWPRAGELTMRAVEPGDAEWVRASLEAAWGSVLVARRSELLDASSYPGFVASIDGEPAGLAVYCRRGEEYEILSVSSGLEGAGVGRALMRQCFDDAATRGCRRVWLTTTNNNVRAISFYQQLGMTICALHLGAVADARRLKPMISLYDDDGVAIEHELEFELLLVPSRGR
jgi:ribosomal protein S18 acetylase RimI-like enzyme